MKTTKLKCKACGKTFTPTWSTHKYCTLECRKRNTYLKERERIRTDPEYRDEVNQRQRIAYRVHNEDRLKKKKIYHTKNKEKINALHKDYYHRKKDDPSFMDKRRAQKREYQSRPEVKAAVNDKLKKRLKEDTEFYLMVRSRGRIRVALLDHLRGRHLKATRKLKGSSTVELLGCSIAAFKEHIEKQFTKGMTWDKLRNGKIHLDHIRPCCSFNLLDHEEQKKCFHFSNVQPLWASDNLRKNRKWLDSK